MERHCHHCGAELPRSLTVGRRDACLKCGWDLRVCLNCDHYAPGYHNDCKEPDAERQVDKSAGNFCDFFRFKSGGKKDGKPGADPKSALEALFAKK